MKSLLRALPIFALATFVSLAEGQTTGEMAGNAAGTPDPLNLSLPRSDGPTVNWERSENSEIRREENIRFAAGDRRSDKDADPGRQNATRRPGGIPYGSGFEARQRSTNGGRGMARGR
ncbi:MAG: hypothetical protein WCV99_10585 [Sterolibacterium sp.]|jgi:hypothetical protein